MPGDYMAALELAMARAEAARFHRAELSLEQLRWAVEEIRWLRLVVKRHQELHR